MYRQRCVKNNKKRRAIIYYRFTEEGSNVIGCGSFTIKYRNRLKERQIEYFLNQHKTNKNYLQIVCSSVSRL
jgi:hypothetical protein